MRRSGRTSRAIAHGVPQKKGPRAAFCRISEIRNARSGSLRSWQHEPSVAGESRPMHAKVVRELGVEARDRHAPFAGENGFAAQGGEHADLVADARDAGRADE